MSEQSVRPRFRIRPKWRRGVFAAPAACLTLLAALGLVGAEVTRASPPASPVSARADANTLARSAKTVSLNENGDLHLTSRHGFTLNEQGAGTGTISGTIYVHLKIVSTRSVTAEVNIYPSGGSISGYGTASYRREGATGHFSGSLSVERGTGSYNHAHGSGLSFSGTIQRSNYAVTVHVNGTVTD
jgi:hypothetical protein